MLRVTTAPSRVWTVLNRMLIGVVGSAGAVLIGVPGLAMAQPPAPPPPPPPPNVNAMAPVKLSEYAVMDNQWYAFKTPDGLTCVVQRNGGYGCSGPIPAAPEGANLVSGGPGAPAFATSAGDVFGSVPDVKPLPAGSRHQLPDGQLRQRRLGDDVFGQPQPVRLRAQPRGELHHQRRPRPAAGTARGHQPLHQLSVRP